MATIKDLYGMRFGRLTVVGRGPNTPAGQARWRLVCDCGNASEAAGQPLREGKIQSCGCLRSDTNTARNLSHGMSATRLYNIWILMRARCSKPTVACYRHYGGRGISVCPEWARFEPFRDWALANGYDAKLTLDRRDVDGNYGPNNCAWVTWAVQRRNQRAVAKRADGTPWPDVAEAHGISVRLYGSRVTLGWDRQDAATVPKLAPGHRRAR